MQLNINNTAVVSFANKLEKLSSTALPNVVRETLNKAALDVKKVTMPMAARDAFTQRKSDFFRGTSHVEFASGKEIDNMRSTIGFIGNQQAVQDLEEQEHGGKIGGRSFIPMNDARKGATNKGLVRANAQIKKLKFVDAKKAKGKNEGQRFAKSVFFAGKGGIVLGEYKGRQILWRVNSLNRTEDGRFKLTALYTFSKGRSVEITKKTHFMDRASLKSADKLQDIFIKEAEKRFERELR